MALGAVVFIPATFLTKAEPMDHVDEFNRQKGRRDQTHALGRKGPRQSDRDHEIQAAGQHIRPEVENDAVGSRSRAGPLLRTGSLAG